MKNLPPRQVSRALASRGYSQYQLGNLTEALDDTKKSLALKPDFITPSYNLAVILLRQEKFAEAKIAYENAMKLGPLDGVVEDFLDLRNKFHGPPETVAFLGWYRIAVGKQLHKPRDVNEG